MRICTRIPVILAATVCNGCKPSRPASPSNGGGSGGPAGWPAELLLATEPVGAKPVGEVRKSAKAGTEVVVIGRVGGRKDPFVSGRAILMLADSSIKACGEGGVDDGCTAPWDFCCETPEHLLANTLTVQVVDGEGKPLKHELRGWAGIKPLSELVIRGVIATGSDESSVVVHATGIFVKRS